MNVLALIVEDEKGGFNVVDSRDGEAITWRSSIDSANEVAIYLNSTYPKAPYPAWESLVHEVIGYRISGEPALSLHSLISVGRLRASCPSIIPSGPGWDHLFEEAA